MCCSKKQIPTMVSSTEPLDLLVLPNTHMMPGGFLPRGGEGLQVVRSRSGQEVFGRASRGSKASGCPQGEGCPQGRPQEGENDFEIVSEDAPQPRGSRFEPRLVFALCFFFFVEYGFSWFWEAAHLVMQALCWCGLPRRIVVKG